MTRAVLHQKRLTGLDESWIAVLLTCLEYVANDLGKKKRHFLMNVITVFLTVSLITFLDMMSKLSPILAVKQNMATSGDYDILMQGYYNEALKNGYGNQNWYTDEQENFNAPYMTEPEKLMFRSETEIQQKLPLVNFTAVQQRVKERFPDPEKQNFDLFPRWMSQTSLYNADRTKFTSAYMVVGDSKLERNIGIAPGFPVRVLGQDELVTTSDILTVLGLEEGDTVQTDIDLIQIVSPHF